MGVEHPTGPDKGTETGDKPAPQSSSDRPPADDPGSGEKSRVQELRQSGWKLNGQPETSSGSEQTGEGDQQTGESSSDSDPKDDKQHGPGEPKSEADPETEKEPETGKTDPEGDSRTGGHGRETDQPRTETAGTDGRDQDPRTTDTEPRQPPAESPGAQPAGETGNGTEPTGAADASQNRDNGREPTKGPAERTEPTPDQPWPGASEAAPADQTAPTSTAPTGETSDRQPTGQTTPQDGQAHPQDNEPRPAEVQGSNSEANSEPDGKSSGPHTETIGDKSETTDKAESPEHTATPPTDNPGSPTQPLSRTESLRQAGWEFPGLPDNGSQQAETTDAAPGTEQPQEKDGQALPQQGDSRTPEHPPAGDQTDETADQEQEAGTPKTDEVRLAPDTSNEPLPTEQNPPAADKTDDNGSEPHHEPAGDNTEHPPGPQDQRQQGTPEQPPAGDGSTEPPGSSDQNPQTRDQQPPADDPTPQPESPEQPPDDPVNPPDTEQSKPQDDNTQVEQPPGDQDGDHDKNAEGTDTEQPPNEINETTETNPETRTNPDLSNVYTDSRGRVHIEPRYGREQTSEPGNELAQNQPETTDPTGLPTREELDPAGAHGGETGRGELRDPENDPENRNPLDEDTEGLSRWKKTGREFIRRPEDVAKTTEGLAKDIGKLVNWDRPTGVAESKPAIEMKPHHESIQGTNAAIGVLGAGIIAYEVARRTRTGIRNIREKMTGAERAHN